MTVNLLQSTHFLALFPERIAIQLVNAGVVRVLPFALASRVEPVVVVWSGTLKSRKPAYDFKNFVLQHAKVSAQA